MASLARTPAEGTSAFLRCRFAPRPAPLRRHRRGILVRLDQVEDRPLDVDDGAMLLEDVLTDEAVNRAARERREGVADRAEVGDHHPPLANLHAAERQAADRQLTGAVGPAETGGAGPPAGRRGKAEMSGMID